MSIVTGDRSCNKKTRMDIDRRTFLKSVGYATSALALRAESGSAQSASATCSIILDASDQTRWTKDMVDVLQGFLARTIPIAVIVDPASHAKTATPLPDRLLRALRETPHLVELVAWSDDTPDPRAYFQLRSASEAATAMKIVLALGKEEIPLNSFPVSVAWRQADIPLGMNGVRSVGFRNVILAPGSSKATTDGGCPGPVTCASGGMRLALSTDPAEVASIVASEARETQHFQVFLKPDNTDDGSIGDLAAALAANDTQATLILPRDRVFSWRGDTSRRLSVCLEAPEADDERSWENFIDLSARLQELSIPFSVLASADQPSQFAAETIPILQAADADSSKWQDALAQSDHAGIAAISESAPSSRELARAGLRHVLNLQAEHPSFMGMDAAGISHFVVLASLDGLARTDIVAELGPHREGVLMVPAGGFATRARSNAILSVLRRIGEVPSNRLLPLSRFVEELQPPMPVYTLMMDTEARHADLRLEMGSLPAPEVEELIKDARQAWSFFEAYVDEQTGLTPATVLTDKTYRSTHNTLTMWDVGSSILGLVSAERLGLTSRSDARERAERILASLDRALAANVTMLPPNELDYKYPWVIDPGYNACDTGRLLSALAILGKSAISPDGLSKRMADLELDQMVSDKRLHTMAKGRKSPAERSHCTEYAARAFAAWGIKAEYPYSNALAAEDDADARMRLLFTAARLGQLGAEPLLLEAVEFGLSDATGYLADVLLGAQIAAHEETSAMYCVSEGPLPIEPWFTYQGLDISNRLQPWKVTAIANKQEYRTDRFRRTNLMTSSKAAYLWAAQRWHPYSAKLVAYVRGRARREEPGFAAGVFMETGSPTLKYSDANTNGVILQAIDAILTKDVRPGDNQAASP